MALVSGEGQLSLAVRTLDRMADGHGWVSRADMNMHNRGKKYKIKSNHLKISNLGIKEMNKKGGSEEQKTKKKKVIASK